MIKANSRYDDYAYRVAYFNLSDTVESIEEGQFGTFDENGEVVLADSTSKKVFLVIGSKRAGRDQISGKATKRIAFLHGPFLVSISNYDEEGTYNGGLTPLKISDEGTVTPVTAEGTDIVVAYAIGQPSGGFLTIVSNN